MRAGELLSARLTVDYRNRPGVVRDVPFSVGRGEIVGLIGQSGSGKSTLALAVLRLLGHKGGSVRGELLFENRDLLGCREREMRQIRGRRIGLVMQSPLSALNPALTLRTQMDEAWRAHAGGSRSFRNSRFLEAFASVRLPAEESFLDRYPRQLSVGQAQRVLIAMAILHRPPLLIADEPTSALDTITAAEVLRLFARLRAELSIAILLISHDLLSVASLCDRVLILNEGELVESAPTAEIFQAPRHPYTAELIAALPRLPDHLAAPVWQPVAGV